MKIISDFVDFYDQHQELHFNSQPPLIYMRRTQKVDSLTSLKINEDLGVQKLGSRTFSSDQEPKWSIVPFIIGVSGRINHGVIISSDDNEEYSYTRSGAHYLSKKLGITVTDRISDMFERHFAQPISDKPCVFKRSGLPVFVITFDETGASKIKSNPRLIDYGYPKACSTGEIYMRIKTFIDDLLDVDPRHPQTCRVYGYESSGWSSPRGYDLPSGY